MHLPDDVTLPMHAIGQQYDAQGHVVARAAFSGETGETSMPTASGVEWLNEPGDELFRPAPGSDDAAREDAQPEPHDDPARTTRKLGAINPEAPVEQDVPPRGAWPQPNPTPPRPGAAPARDDEIPPPPPGFEKWGNR
jgi:hypothetical protein